MGTYVSMVFLNSAELMSANWLMPTVYPCSSERALWELQARGAQMRRACL